MNLIWKITWSAFCFIEIMSAAYAIGRTYEPKTIRDWAITTSFNLGMIGMIWISGGNV